MADTAATTLELQQSPTVGFLAGALSKAQAKIVNPTKNKTAKVPMKTGGTYSYNYADLPSVLEAIHKPFSDNGLVLVQFPETEIGGTAVRTILLHESGEWMSSRLACKLSDERPQSLGSAITYLRRYAAQSAAGIAAEEDDDAAYTQSHPVAKPAPKPAQKPVAAPVAVDAEVVTEDTFVADDPVEEPGFERPAPKPTPKPKPAPKAKAPAAIPEDAYTLCDVIDKMSKKETKKPGSFRYGFHLKGLDQWCNTFSQDMAIQAEILIETKTPVIVTVRDTQYGKDCLDIAEDTRTAEDMA